MPYDSNGNYTLPDSYFVENGDTVLPIQHNPPFEDVSQALSQVLLRNGAAPMSGDLKMGTKKITGMADGTAATDAVTKQQLDAPIASINAALPDFVEDLIPTWISSSTMQVTTGRMRMNKKFAACTSAFTKSLNLNFAPGTGVGGLDTGVKANNATYHKHGLYKDSDGGFDWCYSLSSVAPAAISGYTPMGRIGCCKTDGSGNIIQQFQVGNNVRLANLVTEMSVTTAVANGLVALSALPDGISVDALLTLVCSANAGGCQVLVGGYYSPAGSGYHDIAANSGNSVSSTVTDQVDGYARSSTGRQVYRAVNAVAAAITAQIYTIGWNDYTVPRGKR